MDTAKQAIIQALDASHGEPTNLRAPRRGSFSASELAEAADILGVSCTWRARSKRATHWRLVSRGWAVGITGRVGQ